MSVKLAVAVAFCRVTAATVTVTVKATGLAGALVRPSCVPKTVSCTRVAEAGRVKTATPAAFLTTQAYLQAHITHTGRDGLL